MTRQIFRVTGMSCASCANNVESMIFSINGVSVARVNFAASNVLVGLRSKIL